jgi:hypothetical protein
MSRASHLAFALALASSVGSTRVASAETEGVVATPRLYSLPWLLRSVTLEHSLRVDSAAAVFNDAQGNLDVALSTMMAANYQLTSRWAPTLRLGFVGNNAPGAALDGSSFVNPVVGIRYGWRTGSYKLALSAATAIPVGMGGGDAPDSRVDRTNTASIAARPADSAMFEANYLTEIVGADAAYVNHGVTVQAEATLSQGFRVRGNHSAAGADSFRTNAAVGLHLGYFLGSHVSLGGDLQYQRWLSHPTSLDVMSGARVPLANGNLDTVSATVGLRLHLEAGTHATLHPGISFTRGLDGRGLDAPLITAEAIAVQIDLPVTF